MKTFLEYVNEKIASDGLSVTPFYNYSEEQRKKELDVEDIIWIQSSKLEEISSYLNKKGIEAEVENEKIRVKLPTKYGSKNKSFLLIPDNVLVLYKDTYKVLDKGFIKDYSFLHRLSTIYKKKFKFFW